MYIPLAARPFKIKGFADKLRVLVQILQFKTTDEHQDDGNNYNLHEWPVAEENWVEEGFLCGKKRLQLKPVLNPYWTHNLLTHIFSIENSPKPRVFKPRTEPVLNPYFPVSTHYFLMGLIGPYGSQILHGPWGNIVNRERKWNRCTKLW